MQNYQIPKTFKQAQKKLAKLQAFDYSKLHSSSKDEKLVDDFTITLSVVITDIVTLDLISSIYGNSKPFKDLPKKPKKEWWQYSGVNTFLVRASFVLILDLLKKLNKNNKEKGCIFHKIINNNIYKSVLSKMSKKGKESWTNLIDVANNQPSTFPNKHLIKTIRGVRNKIYGHYDFEEIPKGFEQFFMKSPKNNYNKKAFLSNGRNMWEMRFYYADATVEGYIQKLLGKKQFHELENKRQEISNYIVFGIYSFIITYLTQIKKI